MGILFGIQWQVAGHWNYQGGERKSFSHEFPYANGKSFDDASATAQVTNLGEYEPPFKPYLLPHYVAYFLVGRFGGIVPYYFPAVLGVALFLIYGRGEKGRGLYRWLVLGGAVVASAVYIVMIPTNTIGGGGTVANRYFMNIMPLLFFLLPERTPRWAPLAAAVGGIVFIGHILISPISTSQKPAYYSETPVLRLLPVEYTMLNDLPINTESERRRVPWYRKADDGEEIAFFLYHLDHASFLKTRSAGGEQRLWIKGGRRAELVIRTAKRLKTITVRVTNINRTNDVGISVQGGSKRMRMAPREKKTLVFRAVSPFAYYYMTKEPSYIYTVVAETGVGLTPRTQPGGENDWRYLGAMLEFQVEEE
jgi:hypothetical protein